MKCNYRYIYYARVGNKELRSTKKWTQITWMRQSHLNGHYTGSKFMKPWFSWEDNNIFYSFLQVILYILICYNKIGINRNQFHSFKLFNSFWKVITIKVCVSPIIRWCVERASLIRIWGAGLRTGNCRWWCSLDQTGNLCACGAEDAGFLTLAELAWEFRITRCSACFLDLAFHVAECGGCISIDLERY